MTERVKDDSDGAVSNQISTPSSTSTRVPSISGDEEPNANEKQIKDNTSVKSDQPQDDEYPSGLGLAFIMLAIVLSIFQASLDMTIVATAIPKITDEFGGLDKVSWYSSAFFLTNGAFQSSWGKAYKYFPLKITFLLSIIVFELGSLICAVAPNATALIIGRAITGLGASGIGTGAYTIIAFVVTPQKRAMYTGFVGISYGVASVIGPLLGGVFADKLSWRWCFYINLPIGGVSATVILFLFHAPSGAKPIDATWRERFLQMDPIGVVMMMGALVSFILALEYGGQTMPWSSSTVIGLLVGYVVIMAAFAVWETYQAERAMIVPRLIKQRVHGINVIYTICFTGPYYMIVYYLPIYFQSVHNASAIKSGVLNLPLIIAVTISMISSGIFISSTGLIEATQMLGTAIAMIGAGLLYTFGLNTGLGKWIGYQIVGGVGWGLSFQIPLIATQAAAAPEDISSVTALILFCMNWGGTSFITSAQSIFVNKIIDELPKSAPGINPATLIATGATQIRTTFPADKIPGIVVAYMGGIHDALVMPLGGVGASLIAMMFFKWWKRPKPANTPAAATIA